MCLKGLDEFLQVFGNITIGQVVVFLIAIAFLIAVGKYVRDYLIKKHEAERIKNEQLQEALTAVQKYSEFRQQSINIQELLEKEIQETRAQNVNVQNLLEAEIQELRKMLVDHTTRLVNMENANIKRERNKIRDMLLQSYRYYTNQETNPTQSWTKMESEAFWELFKDYEEAGGDGYMHSDVQPAMERLLVVELPTK